MDFATLHKQRKFVMIAALVGIIGTFLRWYSWDAGIISGGVSGTSFGAGVITLLGLAGAGVLAFLGDQKTYLSKNSWLIVLGIAALTTVLCFIKLISNRSGASLGIGLFLSLAGSIGTLAAAFLFKNPNDDLKQSLNEVKRQVENKVDNNPNT
jgi:hypothetical protein